ncbi:MAG: alpha-hydroxy acid oxidase [Paracoccaceae bacterium]
MSDINPEYPDVNYLRDKAKKRIPRFAFEYLDGGCNSEVNLVRNTQDIRNLKLRPNYLGPLTEVSLKTTLFGKTYDAPFGVSPIGLQGLMWPNATEILAKASFEANIPFILSTVGTASIETVAEITEGNAWFQLYNPTDPEVRNDLFRRLEASGIDVLVLLADVPSFGYRSKEIRNGLSIPPKLNMRNIAQILSKPKWAFNTLIAGQPTFKTLTPYIPKGLSLKHLGLFMNKTFDGRLSPEIVQEIRHLWKGKLVVKGITTEEDAQKCIDYGVDGIIVSNHGGRQLDLGESAIESLRNLAPKYRSRIQIMMDSGIRNGSDIAGTLASGADFAFLGRTFMYGVSALGKKGGTHTIEILKKQLHQVMQQLDCRSISDLPDRLIK